MKKGKKEEYKAPQELQRTETSIYRGGTRAEEWQASTLNLEHHCAHSNTNKHSQIYACWYTLGTNFYLPLQIIFASFPVLFFPLHHTHGNLPGLKTLREHTVQHWRREGEVKEGRGVCLTVRLGVGGQITAYNLTSETQSISVNESLVLGGGCWQQINNIWCTFPLSSE